MRFNPLSVTDSEMGDISVGLSLLVCVCVCVCVSDGGRDEHHVCACWGHCLCGV